jgi:LeuA allosteric (dimerisation) domain
MSTSSAAPHHGEPANEQGPREATTFRLERWSASSSNNRPSRASLVLRGGGRAWRAHAAGNGAVDALMRAVDDALAPILGSGVELQTYNVQATGQGHETPAAVSVSIRRRSDAGHAPAYPGRGQHDNVLEATVLAYVDAINRLVAHEEMDVATLAPAHQPAPLPQADDDQSRAFGERFTKMFNH